MVMKMFLKNEDFSVKILSVHELEWEKRDDYSDLRTFHALSFRVLGEAIFYNNNNTINTQSGDILYVPHLLRYRLKSEKEHLYVVHFTSEDEIANTIKKFVPSNPKYFERKFSDLYNAWTKKQPGYYYECKSIFFKILMEIEYETAQRTVYKRPDDFLDTINYIHENFTDRSLTVHYLADRANMSETYFRKLFLQYAGVSPKAFIDGLRLQYAIELLKSGYYTVSEISDKCGFENVYYFSSFVKSKTGNSPSEIRKNDTK